MASTYVKKKIKLAVNTCKNIKKLSNIKKNCLSFVAFSTLNTYKRLIIQIRSSDHEFFFIV